MIRYVRAAGLALLLTTAAPMGDVLQAQPSCVTGTVSWYAGRECTMGSLTFREMSGFASASEYSLDADLILATPFSFVDHDLYRWSGFRFTVGSPTGTLSAFARFGAWGNDARLEASVIALGSTGMAYGWLTTGYSAPLPPYPTDGGYAGLGTVAIFGNNPDGQSVNVNSDTWQTFDDGRTEYQNWNPNTSWLFGSPKDAQYLRGDARVQASIRTLEGQAYAELRHMDLMFREGRVDPGVVPEPGSLALLATGLVVAGAVVRRRPPR